ncbi:MAG: insulinase family protein [Myxococcales bacterium]|nr:insulinase family protein [Myxococcales bacterium]
MTRAFLGMVPLILLGCPPKQVAEPAGPQAELARPLPVDPGVRSGVLDNGLAWYIEVNREPAQRAVLRLAVDAGSVLEDDDQLGLAHFVEHMAFNGTENFPGNDMIRYLESVGTRFGPHLNAHTSFEETVYKLTVPTDDAEVFDKAFVVLSDWAGGMTFDPAEIDAERGVVLEEWRTRLGPSERIREQIMPKIFFGSPYPDRMPIGTETSLKTFEHEAATRFYRDWYRPDLMAVVAVGDFDPDVVQAKIEERFSGLKAAAEPRERARPEIPDHTEVLDAVVADPEVPRASLQLMAKADMPWGTTHGDYRTSLMEQVAFSVVNERLAEISRQPDPPFLGASAGKTKLTPTEGAWVVGAALPDGGALRAYEALLTEIERVQRHGVRAAELQRAKAAVVNRYDRLLAEKDKTDSVTHANELVRVFLTNESMPGIDYEVGLAKQYVPEFTVEEVSAWVSEGWMPARSRVISVVMPQKEDVEVPASEDLRAVEQRVAAATIEALPEETVVGELLAALPEPGSVATTETVYSEALGFTRWELSNGVSVWSKATDFKDDEIRFRAFAPGGMSRVSDDDYVSGGLAVEVAQRSGFGEHDVSDLSKWSAGHSFSVSRRLTETWQTLSGRSSVADLEMALQLVHAGFTAPRFSEDGLSQTRTLHTERLLNRDQDPNTHFYDAFNLLVWPEDPRRAPWTVDTLQGLTLEQARQVYADRFGDASGWTFVFVGNLPDGFQDLVLRYLASLPAESEAGEHADRGMRPATGVLQTEVRKGIDPKARVRLHYHGAFSDNTWVARNRLYAMADVLSVLLREKLREELGGVYGVSVRASEAHRPWDNYSVSIQFQCDPERVDELLNATQGVLDRLRMQGPDASYVEQEQEKNRRQREIDLRENSFWLSAFTGALQRGADPMELLTWDARNDSLTPREVQDTAKQLLNDRNRAKVVLLPAEASPE